MFARRFESPFVNLAKRVIFPLVPAVACVQFLDKNRKLDFLPSIANRAIRKLGDYSELTLFATQVCLVFMNIVRSGLRSKLEDLATAGVFIIHFITPSLLVVSNRLNMIVLNTIAIINGIRGFRSKESSAFWKTMSALQVALCADAVINSLVFDYLGKYFLDSLFYSFYKLIGKPTFPPVTAFLKPYSTVELDYGQIQQILSAGQNDFEINPSHCSKAVRNIRHVTLDSNFDSFLELFNGYNREDFESTLSSFAQSTDKDPSSLYDLAKANLAHLVRVLKKEDRNTKHNLKLNEMITMASQVLAYLKQPDSPDLQRQILADLALRGRECLDGQRRALQESLDLILQQSHDYPTQLLQRLEVAREQLVFESIRETASIMRAIFRRHNPQLMGDTHVANWHRKAFFFFSPHLKPNEEEFSSSAISIIFSTVQQRISSNFYSKWQAYNNQLDRAISETGEQRFTNYFINMIDANEQLTLDQKEQIGSDFILSSYSLESYHRLVLVQLGVLRYRGL
jgi:hypothetical protein